MTMNGMECGFRSERFERMNFRKLAEHHALGVAAESENEKRRRMALAIQEAEALACETGVPELVLLTLAEEKVRAVRQWYARQGAINQRSAKWSLAA